MSDFITIPMRNVRTGDKFLPIERMGSPVYVVRKRRWERAWRKAERSYVAVSLCHGVDADGKDALFSLYDWAIVRRKVPDNAPHRAASPTDMARKLRDALATT